MILEKLNGYTTDGNIYLDWNVYFCKGNCSLQNSKDHGFVQLKGVQFIKHDQN